MFDKEGIYKRFAQCHSVTNSSQLAKICGVSRQTAHSWKTGKNPIPWEYLKEITDTRGVSWDWLLEGKDPQYGRPRKSMRRRPFNRHTINKRFLSLFPYMPQAEIAHELGVQQTSVFRWCHDMAQVPWERLRYAVTRKKVTWDWLLEGRKGQGEMQSGTDGGAEDA